jgi:diguanylate cyclase (GGDEF)-like protein/PAS domain S-box-containing protein
LNRQAIELEEQGAMIEEHNMHLEEMVKERTVELAHANKERLEQWEVIDQFVMTSTTDKEGKITYVSKAFCDFLGYSKEELLGKTHRIIKSPNVPKELYIEMWDTITQSNCWLTEWQNKAKDGTLHWVKVQVSPLLNDKNEIKGYTAIRENIDDLVETKRLAITDQLTRLYNRREIDRVLANHADFNQRYGMPCSVIMVDMDKFKEVNDIYGHQVGDVVLQELATILKKRARNTDIVGRWGGEEFLIILPNSKKSDAVIVAESLRVAVESFVFTCVGQKTISLGVAAYEQSVDEMIKRADDALYLAKEGGRNRVES